MGDLLEKFRAAMGFALLEYRGEGEFSPIAPLPPWFHQVWGEETGLTAPLALLEKSPFLENFLYEAEAFWESPGERACQSETWVEKTADGREIALQARALLLEGRRALVIFNPDAEFREQVKTLQTARNALLDHERLAHEIQKKEILLHCIVHDLSQPLSVMHVAMECLANDAISERSKQFLTLGKLASDQQETMIRDILHTFSSDLRASLDAGTEESAAADLLGCARQSMTALGPTFEAKGVSLALAPALDPASSWPVRAEDSRLRRIFANLLENALRYTPARGRVTVGMEDEGGFLKAYVDDEGPGLPRRFAAGTNFRAVPEREAKRRQGRARSLFLPHHRGALGRQHRLCQPAGQRLALLVSFAARTGRRNVNDFRPHWESGSAGAFKTASSATPVAHFVCR